jgi:2-hydroxy-4-carboxymuconate semialdehyde hemiacetal dehydrogenase
MIGIGMVGHGMMGRWHSEALKLRADCRLRILIGRRLEPTEKFAREFGYDKWSTKLDDLLDDPAVHVAVIASPSEDHASMAIKALEHGKHALVEIPIGMSYAESAAVVEAAKRAGRKLGLVYPMRMMADMKTLRDRIAAGQEELRLVESRFIIERWENVGATGYRRSWTDNLLWHHLSHLVDFAMWLTGSTPRSISGHLPAPDPKTGTPMDVFVGVSTDREQSLIFLGSYAGHRPICDTLVLTNRDCYQLDAVSSSLTTAGGTTQLPSEQVDCAAALCDFLDAVRNGREPAITGQSTLSTMRILQLVQNAWDAKHGIGPIPGRVGPRDKEGRPGDARFDFAPPQGHDDIM